MRTLCLLIALWSVSAAAAPLAPLDRVTFDRLWRGQLDGLVLLGFSPDGASWAWVEGSVGEASGLVEARGALMETATTKVRARYHLTETGAPNDKALLRGRPSYDEFLDKVRAAGVAPEHAMAWKKEGDRFVSPDGQLAIWVGKGHAREIAPDTDHETSMTLHSVILDDLAQHDRAVLFELYSGSIDDDHITAPTIVEVYGSAQGDGFVVHTAASSKFLCYDALDSRVFASTLTRVRAGAASRAANQEGMVAYRAGDHRAAQAAFRRAVQLDLRSPRARYNLAAVSARLGDDHEALRMLSVLGGENLALVKLKMKTDPDFAEARRKPTYAKYVDPDSLDEFGSTSRAGFATKLDRVTEPFSLAKGIKLDLTVVNRNDKPARFCRWYTPFETERSAYLEVLNAAGKTIAYHGVLARRGPPGTDDYMTVSAKDQTNATFDLSKDYELVPGTYTVRFRGSRELPDSLPISITVVP